MGALATVAGILFPPTALLTVPLIGAAPHSNTNPPSDQSTNADAGQLSWDWGCWKPVLHEWDSPASGGKPLDDILIDHRIRGVEILNAEKHRPRGLRITDYPELVLENVWGERFLLYYVWVPGHGPAGHCVELPAVHDEEEGLDKLHCGAVAAA